jgi:hypothetical protein
MAIPSLNELGYLPEGIHDCTLEELAERFGAFRGSDRRPQLCAKFKEFLQEAKASGLFKAVVVDGSFVSARSDPNDVDLVLIVAEDHDFSVELPPVWYNLLTQRRVRKRFGFDIVVVRMGSENLDNAIAFFQQIRQSPGLKKGVLRITL